MLPFLKEKYGRRIRQEFISVRMHQTKRSCYLEICKETIKLIHTVHHDINKYYDSRDFIITRENSIITDRDTPCFTPDVPVTGNAENFFKAFDGGIPGFFTELFKAE